MRIQPHGNRSLCLTSGQARPPKRKELMRFGRRKTTKCFSSSVPRIIWLWFPQRCHHSGRRPEMSNLRRACTPSTTPPTKNSIERAPGELEITTRCLSCRIKGSGRSLKDVNRMISSTDLSSRARATRSAKMRPTYKSRRTVCLITSRH